MRNVLLTIEYDGSGFHGWQVQPHARTVQGILEEALTRVCGQEVHINGTSRTDAGVHAYGQCASFLIDSGIPTERIPLAVNNLFTDVKVISAEEKPADFHARFSAKGKTYLYRICASESPDLFLRSYRYLLNETLDTGKMEAAAQHLTGEHDFAAFRAAGGQDVATTVRNVSSIDIDTKKAADTKGRPCTEYEVRVTGDGFLYNMVRIIVGTLVETGRGVREPKSAKEALASRDRSLAGHTAPAAGLWLEKIYY
jgi:tRNA pseudouridine38-40 synthase